MEYLDYVNVMTYDMGKPPKHNSPLYRSSTFSQTSCQESIELHVKAGVARNRMNMGVPFYGHGISPYASDVKYNEMDAILNAASGTTYYGKNIRRWDNTAKVPYLVDGAGTILLGYDDPESVEIKGKFVKDSGILGAMFWEFRHDDAKGSMRKALCKGIYGKESTTD